MAASSPATSFCNPGGVVSLRTSRDVFYIVYIPYSFHVTVISAFGTGIYLLVVLGFHEREPFFKLLHIGDPSLLVEKHHVFCLSS